MQNHLNVHKEKFFDLQIFDILQQLFPHVRLSGDFKAKSYSYPSPPSKPQPPRRPMPTPAQGFLLPNGKDPYKLQFLVKSCVLY